VERHYRSILLNLIDGDASPESALLSLVTLAGGLARTAEEKDWGFIRDLLDVLRSKEAAFASHPPFRERMNALLLFVEDLILDGAEGPGFDAILSLLGPSARGEESILIRIFDARTVTTVLLQFLLQTCSPGLERVKERIERAAADGPLLDRIADALAAVDSRPAVEVFKLLYASGNADLRIKVLSLLKSQTILDEPFLFSALRSDDPRLRAGALANLVRTKRTLHVALRRLLGIDSIFGRKNRTILQNLDIVEGMGIREAAPLIRALVSRAGFWNAPVRRAGARILEAWHEG
jgi:hypothetical protein